MKLVFQEITLTCKRGVEHIAFVPFNFFYGRMGAGKSTIVRLLDFCLGGSLEMTPALQSEFVSATLTLTIGSVPVALTRQRDSVQVEAAWVGTDGPFQILIPARKAANEVLPGTGVEVLSDLLFYLAGVRPPRVRRSKVREDAEMERLSFRDLYWYCFLDQENIDSSFFYLERGADTFRQLKSRHVMRFVLGYHQERVAEMEAELEDMRLRKMRAEEGARALGEALVASGLGTTEEITLRETTLRERLESVGAEIKDAQFQLAGQRDHAVEQLRSRARALSAELQALDEAIASVEKIIDNDRRHKNELITLSMKFRRVADARAVLSQVEFTACPRCTQALLAHEGGCCNLCGRLESEPTAATEQTLDVDVNARIAEIEDLIGRHTRQLEIMRRDHSRHAGDKRRVDRDLNEASQRYDSAYLSSTIQLEREQATIQQQVVELDRIKSLDQRRKILAQEAAHLDGEALKLRRELAEARAAAERDTRNLRRLADLFLDCILRARLPGFNKTDHVSIVAPGFLPEVSSAGSEDTTVTSFSHLGSGGKKTLFKCCFAVALHRLATEIGAVLPTVLVIDTAMKNISERENRDQFSGFYSMLYDLASSELKATQFVIVDKEFFPPPEELEISLSSRALTPDDPERPPLIRYYKGH